MDIFRQRSYNSQSRSYTSLLGVKKILIDSIFILPNGIEFGFKYAKLFKKQMGPPILGHPVRLERQCFAETLLLFAVLSHLRDKTANGTKQQTMFSITFLRLLRNPTSSLENLNINGIKLEGISLLKSERGYRGGLYHTQKGLFYTHETLGGYISA